LIYTNFSEDSGYYYVLKMSENQDNNSSNSLIIRLHVFYTVKTFLALSWRKKISIAIAIYNTNITINSMIIKNRTQKAAIILPK